MTKILFQLATLCFISTFSFSANASLLCKQVLSGHGETVYHLNGQVLSYHTGDSGATWYHSNGKVFTYHMGKADATWYKSDGSVLTYHGPALSSEDMWEEACELAFGY